MNFKKIIVTSTALLVLSTSAFAKRLHNEAYYVNNFCHKLDGAIEFRFDDNTRCDCKTSTHAIEIDFANKWYEGLGQALYYGIKANKKPGLGIIIEKSNDLKYLKRLKQTIDFYKLDVDIFQINGIEEKQD